ncbi:MAG: SDR family oxidoreductase [Deltaproteobacteria bacterium]|nr:SDR family oxidoreductase [Deltaproteobacteria bacterium]
MKIQNSTVVVTGAGNGIGHALARGFLEDGAKVVAVDRNGDGLVPLKEKGGITMEIDVSDQSQVQTMVQAAIEQTGRVDVLINNAGIGFYAELVDHGQDQFEELIRINLFGPYYCTRSAIPFMREQGHGRIINLLSRHAETGAKGFSAYGSSKAALWAVTRSGANELASANILVNGLIPGPTKSGMMPEGQDPEVVYPTAKMLATLPPDGPTGKVFWYEKEYFIFDRENDTYNP